MYSPELFCLCFYEAVGRAAAGPGVDRMGVGEVSPGLAEDEARTRGRGEGQVSTTLDWVLIAGSHRKTGCGLTTAERRQLAGRSFLQQGWW